MNDDIATGVNAWLLEFGNNTLAVKEQINAKLQLGPNGSSSINSNSSQHIDTATITTTMPITITSVQAPDEDSDIKSSATIDMTWRTAIDDEIAELSTLIGKLKTFAPHHTNNKDSAAEQFKNAEEHMKSSTFATILRLKTELIGMIRDFEAAASDTHAQSSATATQHAVASNIGKATSQPVVSTLVAAHQLKVDSHNQSISSSSKSAPSSPRRPKSTTSSSSSSTGYSPSASTTSPSNSPSLSRRPAPAAAAASAASTTSTSTSTTTTTATQPSTPIKASSSSSSSSLTNSATKGISSRPRTNSSSAAGSSISYSSSSTPTKPKSTLGTPGRSMTPTKQVRKEEGEDVFKVWIQEVLKAELKDIGSCLPFESSLGLHLQSGVILCRLVNALAGKDVIKKINEDKGFRKHENINNFLTGAQQLGVPKRDIFFSTDLVNLTNMKTVISMLYQLARVTNNNDTLKRIEQQLLNKKLGIADPQETVLPSPDQHPK
ncbi:hypothetical protein SAMD00019534_059210 [Acytostelium subglobosum LB1]|uniref:hypothetical protein n=1 Tax=Acytostelium subglobosum LB1 TaxID=1410327 RepID=UPI000644A3DC|nr:hypothetical protein SAMD00019534_059210 [Acytostelium subglobosum LB1]GAM22746.1 hypothetical protein SAMD00019534_059210 [Acytostelium subglobosum LB1]|eukprot:XP_012753973.1 hypothetical protein SAMD00019534_059210 [Acytostelium subglobosum LB1]